MSFFQVKENGLEDSVMTVEELRSGVESRGTGKCLLDFLDEYYRYVLFQEQPLIIKYYIEFLPTMF